MKFSILIPAYKGLYLEQTINSCLSQTYDDFEIIVLDDCSPDNLTTIVENLNNSKIKYFKNNRNVGAINVVDNWNKCLELSIGEYVICMGDDDMLAPNALQEYALLIDKYPNFNLFHSRVLVIDEDSNPLELTLERPITENQLSFIYARMRGRKMFIGDYCMRSSFLKEQGGYYKLPLAWMTDDITTFICAQMGVANVNEPTFLYRRNRYTITSTGSIHEKLSAVIKVEEWYDSFIENAITNSAIDSLMLSQIKAYKNKFFSNKKSGLIAADFRKNPLHVFWWIKNKKNISFSFRTFCTGIVYSFSN